MLWIIWGLDLKWSTLYDNVSVWSILDSVLFPSSFERDGLEGEWIGRSRNVTFLYFPFQKSIHPSLTEMKLQEQSSLCNFMCVFWDSASSGGRNAADVQA